MRFSLKFACIVTACTSVAFASTKPQLFKPIAAPAMAMQFESAHYARIDSTVAQELLSHREMVDIDVPIETNRVVTLHLEPFDVFDASTKWMLMTKDGPVSLPPPTIATYKGTVDGDPSSHVYLGVSPGSMLGSVRTRGRSYGIEPVPATIPEAQVCMIYDERKHPLATSEVSCMTRDDDPVRDPLTLASAPPGTNDGVATAQYLAKIAIDMDYEAYTFFGGTGAAQTYATNLVGVSSTMYESDQYGVNTQLSIGFFRVWDASSPYTATDLYGALTEFTNFWNTNMTGEDRACAALLSKKGCGASGNGACGLAALDALCIKNRAYSVSQIAGNIDVLDKYVFAHEVGHNFGARHTHSCWWVDQGFATSPIDQCYQVEDGSCFTQIVQSTGTLMSYCQQKDFTWGDIIGPWVKNHVTQIAASGQNCFVASKKLSALDTVVNFGVLHPGTGVDSTFTNFIVNAGQQSISVTGMKLVGTDSASFSIVSGGGSFTLASGAKRTIKLRFTCDSAKAYNTYLQVTHNAPNSPLMIHLEGSGGVPTLDASTNTDGDSMVWMAGQSGETADIWFSNSGTFPVHVSSTVISGGDSSAFTITSGRAPFDVDPDGIHTVTLKFVGSGSVKRSSLIVTSNAEPPQRTFSLVGNLVDAVRESDATISSPMLGNIYPDPVRTSAAGSATGEFSIHSRAFVSLSLIDVLGREIQSIVHETLPAGTYHSPISTDHLSAGTYFVRMQSAGKTATKLLRVAR